MTFFEGSGLLTSVHLNWAYLQAPHALLWPMGLVVGGHVDRATVSFDYIVVLVQGRVSLPVWARAAVIFRGILVHI